MVVSDRPIPVGVRLPPTLKARLDVVAAERNIFIYELLQEAIENYFGMERKEPADDPSVPGRYRPYLAKLAEILASGDASAIVAVTHNIDFFHERMRPATADVRKLR